MEPLDFRPTTSTLAALVRGVRDDQLAGPTPDPDWSVGDLVDHIGGLSFVFALGARKLPLPEHAGPSGDAAALEDGWRDRVAGQLDDLATAWADPSAYDGTTMAGPVELPADQAALVALNEVTVHAWDLAVATGQPYPADPAAVAAATAFVESFEPPEGGAADDGGLFGPPVAVPADAPALHRLIGATGRHPHWVP